MRSGVSYRSSDRYNDRNRHTNSRAHHSSFVQSEVGENEQKRNAEPTNELSAESIGSRRLHRDKSFNNYSHSLRSDRLPQRGMRHTTFGQSGFRGHSRGSSLSVRNYRGRENFGRGRGGFTSGYRQSEFARTRTYRDEDDNKPVMKLFDPTLVPKSSKYFEHDARDVKNQSEYASGRRTYDNRSRGSLRSNGSFLYDPRVDSFRDRKRVAPTGWRNQYDVRDTKRLRKSGFDDNDYRCGPPRSADDDIWVHDKYEIFEKEEATGKIDDEEYLSEDDKG